MAIDENGGPYGGDVIDYPRIYLKQDGGRYCVFTCPECGSPKGKMKMSANSGWCDQCGNQYQCLSLDPVTEGPTEKVDYYAGLEIIG